MKLLKNIVLLTFVLGCMLLGSTFFTKNQSGEIAGILDRFNPLVSKGAVYVISKKPDNVNGYGTANYIQTAVDEHGNTRPIEFNAIQEMAQGIFVKITNKGAYVETIEKVEESQIPQATLNKLKELSV